MADETLSAAITVKDNASSDLRNIASSFSDVAEDALDAAEGAMVAAESFDEAEDEADSLARSLRSVASAGSAATASLYSVSAAAASVHTGIDGAEDEATDLNRALIQMAGIAPFAAMGGGGAGLFGGGGAEGVEETLDTTERLHESLLALDNFETAIAMDVEPGDTAAGLQDADDGDEVFAAMDIPRIDTEETVSGIKRRALGEEEDFGIDRMLNIGQGGVLDQIFAHDPTTEIDTAELDANVEAVNELGERIRELSPEHMEDVFSVDVSNAKEFEEFASDLKTIDDRAHNLSAAFRNMDDDTVDHLLRNADSAKQLQRGLARTTAETERTETHLASLDGTSRDLMDAMIAGSATAEEFDEQIEEIGKEASTTGAEISSLDGILKNHAINTAIAAESTDELGDELSETGNEAIAAMMKVKAANTAMGSFQSMIGDTMTRIGPFTTTLSTVAQILPTIISLLTVLGGMGVTGLGGLGGLAGILGGGLLAIGERTADQMEATATATGEASQNMQQLEDASSEAERAMIGLQEFMGQLRDAAYEALEPLRQPIFAEFSLSVIEGALTMLREFAEAVAWGAEPLMELSSLVAAAWWDTYPEFMDSLANLMMIVAPLMADMAVGAIEMLPGILDAMATHSAILLPLLMEFGSALADVLPPLLELGTLMLRGILPNLTGFIKGVAVMTPMIKTLTRVLGGLIQIIDPLIEWVFQWGGALMVLNSIVPFLIMLLKGLRAVTSLLLLQPLAGFFWGIVKAGLWASKIISLVTAKLAAMQMLTIVGWIVLLTTAVAAIISHFDLWDEVIGGVIKGVNFLLRGLYKLGAFIANVFILLINTAIEKINELLDKYNLLASVAPGLEEVRLEKMEYRDYNTPDRAQIDPGHAEGLASKVPGQDNSAPTPGMGGMDRDGQVPRPGGYGQGSQQPNSMAGQRGRGRGQQGQRPWQSKTDVTLNVYGENDEKRIEDAVRRGVRQADKRKRRQSSPMN